MIDLAIHSNGEHLALYSIAERQGISTNYLEQVFSLLRKSGLVKSVNLIVDNTFLTPYFQRPQDSEL